MPKLLHVIKLREKINPERNINPDSFITTEIKFCLKGVTTHEDS